MKPVISLGSVGIIWKDIANGKLTRGLKLGKLGVSKNWGCLRTGCWRKYLDSWGRNNRWLQKNAYWGAL